MTRRVVPLPPHWQRIRAVVLLRDRYRCMWGTVESDDASPGQCSQPATDVDHVGDPADHSPENLRSLCAGHHAHRTALQANLARGVAGSAERNPRKRPPKSHPGLRP